jgi:hypothetical protein
MVHGVSNQGAQQSAEGGLYWAMSVEKEMMEELSWDSDFVRDIGQLRNAHFFFPSTLVVD